MSPLIRKLERKFPWFQIPAIVEGLLGLQIAGFFISQGSRETLSEMVLVGQLVLAGEVWRLVSFMAVPPSTSPLFLFFALYLFFIYGRSLRDFWGETKLSFFFVISYGLTCISSFILPLSAFSNGYILSSFFLAFAMVNPTFELRLFFIIPVQVKWLALLTWVFYAVSLVTGSYATKLQIAAVVVTMVLFFFDDIFIAIRGFFMGVKKKSQAVQEKSSYFHKCSVCGKTDRDSPDELFRYKSIDGQSQCFCEEHLQQDASD